MRKKDLTASLHLQRAGELIQPLTHEDQQLIEVVRIDDANAMRLDGTQRSVTWETVAIAAILVIAIANGIAQFLTLLD
jgi:hypothetical protein